MIKFYLFCLILIPQLVFSQTYQLTGKVFDNNYNASLAFVTLKVDGSNFVTTSDEEGKYKFVLPPGYYKIFVSHIGYFTDSIYVNLEESDAERDIYLRQSEILTEEIVVSGEDPAYEIIRNAIRYKNQFNKNLKEYNYNAYSKLVLWSNQMSVKDTLIQNKDTSKNGLGIVAILESETEGFFKKPDLYKEVIKAKKETANTRQGVALPFIVNFYENTIDLEQVKVPGPLSDDAFDNYDYRLLGTTFMDSLPIFKIEMKNNSEVVPQFYGTLYIADSIFSLMKIDLNVNNAAKLRFFDAINFKQKFSQFKDANNNVYWLPTDNQIYGNGSLAGVVKLKAEVFSVVTDYTINVPAPPGTFDKYIIKVLPDAKKDSAYWRENQIIANTPEENYAYKEIERNERMKAGQINISPLSLTYGKYISSVPINYFHFNRVEGTYLGLNANYTSEKFRTFVNGEFGYGLSDKKTKYSLSFTNRFLADKSLVLNISLFRELEPLNFNVGSMARFYNSFRALIDKKDEYDYYYASGYRVSLNASTIPQLRLGISYHQEKQTSAFTNTDYSFRKRDEISRANPPINDAFLRAVGFSLRIDPNEYKYIDWGDDNESRIRMTDFPTLQFSYENSSKKLQSTYDFRKYSLLLQGRNQLTYFLNMTYKAGITHMSGTVPYQSLAYFNANPGGINAALNFKAMDYQEFLGDRLYYINFENNFGKFFWGNVPVLNNLNFIAFYNAGKSEIRKSNYDLSIYKGFSATDGIYQEAGVGVGGILGLFRLDFAWRLNNFKKGENFRIVFSSDNF
ncbi:MAG TPA: DUF5686 family protein [Ignavibacteria bacterium]|nr:DUF5686 family protein [Ignavibacteria bacterium]